MSTSQPIGVLNQNIEYIASQNLLPHQQALSNAANALGARKSKISPVQRPGQTVIDQVESNGYAIQLREENGKAYLGVDHNGTDLGSVKLEKAAGFLGMGQQPMTIEEARQAFSRERTPLKSILHRFVTQRVMQLSQKLEQEQQPFNQEIEMA